MGERFFGFEIFLRGQRFVVIFNFSKQVVFAITPDLSGNFGSDKF